MPWRLLSFLTALIVFAFFIGFNLDNRCDVSIIFYTFRDVPVFVSLLFAYLVGAISLVPFFLAASWRKRRDVLVSDYSQASMMKSRKKNGLNSPGSSSSSGVIRHEVDED
jgi:hypothetical protein